MPGDTAICRKWILDGLKDGSLKMEELDRAAANILKVIEEYVREYPDDSDFAAHDKLACEVAEDCAVLLKNDGMLRTGDLFHGVV